jgi:hypothetical protein
MMNDQFDRYRDEAGYLQRIDIKTALEVCSELQRQFDALQMLTWLFQRAAGAEKEVLDADEQLRLIQHRKKEFLAQHDGLIARKKQELEELHAAITAAEQRLAKVRGR